jgi:hypothetical protein
MREHSHADGEDVCPGCFDNVMVLRALLREAMRFVRSNTDVGGQAALAARIDAALAETPR